GRRMVVGGSFSFSLAAPPLLSDGSGGVYMLAAADYIRVWRIRADSTPAPGWPDDGVPLNAVPDAYGGTQSPSDPALLPGAPGHTFAVWLEDDGTHNNSNNRVAVCSFDDAGNPGPVMLLTTFANRISGLAAQSDNQGGLLVSWGQSGAGLLAAHVLANGTLG